MPQDPLNKSPLSTTNATAAPQVQNQGPSWTTPPTMKAQGTPNLLKPPQHTATPNLLARTAAQPTNPSNPLIAPKTQSLGQNVLSTARQGVQDSVAFLRAGRPQRNSYSALLDSKTAADENQTDLTPIKAPLPPTTQQTDYSCGPAALQAVAKGEGKDLSEKELADKADTSEEYGTTPEGLEDAAQNTGLPAHREHPMSLARLKAQLDQGKPVICDIQAHGTEQEYAERRSGHCVDAVGYDEDNIYFRDPSLNDKLGHLSIPEFLSRWKDQEDDATGGEKTNRYGLIIDKPVPKDPEPVPDTEKISSQDQNLPDLDSRPYRDRVELFGHRNGKILGGIYDIDKNHGVFGGGIDSGEDPAEAGAREYREESGWKIKNPYLLPVPPVTQEWTAPYASKAMEERAKQFRGSRTLFAAGEIGDDYTEPTDPSNLQRIRYRTPSTALRNTIIRRAYAPETAKGRRAALRALIAKLKAQQAESTVRDTVGKAAAFTPLQLSPALSKPQQPKPAAPTMLSPATAFMRNSPAYQAQVNAPGHQFALNSANNRFAFNTPANRFTWNTPQHMLQYGAMPKAATYSFEGNGQASVRDQYPALLETGEDATQVFPPSPKVDETANNDVIPEEKRPPVQLSSPAPMGGIGSGPMWKQAITLTRTTINITEKEQEDLPKWLQELLEEYTDDEQEKDSAYDAIVDALEDQRDAHSEMGTPQEFGGNLAGPSITEMLGEDGTNESGATSLQKILHQNSEENNNSSKLAAYNMLARKEGAYDSIANENFQGAAHANSGLLGANTKKVIAMLSPFTNLPIFAYSALSDKHAAAPNFNPEIQAAQAVMTTDQTPQQAPMLPQVAQASQPVPPEQLRKQLHGTRGTLGPNLLGQYQLGRPIDAQGGAGWQPAIDKFASMGIDELMDARELLNSKGGAIPRIAANMAFRQAAGVTPPSVDTLKQIKQNKPVARRALFGLAFDAVMHPRIRKATMDAAVAGKRLTPAIAMKSMKVVAGSACAPVQYSTLLDG